MDYFFQRRHPPYHLATMAAQTNAQVKENESWFADSGANQHITTSIENLNF